MPQSEWEEQGARISYNLERRFSHVQENSESLQHPEKVAILRLHLLEHTPVSDLCDQHGIHPTMFYRWQKEFFENAAAAFEHRSRRPSDDKDRRIALLEQKLQRKHEVLSELMEEHIKLKKELGELGTESGFPSPSAMRSSSSSSAGLAARTCRSCSWSAGWGLP